MNYFTVFKYDDNLYQIKDALGVLSTLVIGENKALLFDTGYGIGNIKEEVEKITKKPLVVVNSHGHMDHACGNCQFDEIYIDEEDVELCLHHTNLDYRKRNVANARSRGVLPDNFDEEAYYKLRSGNLKLLKEHQIFDLGGLSLEVIKIPGHTQGSVALYIKELKTMLVSDGACPYIWMFLKESTTLVTYLESLRKLLKYDFESFLLGHGAGKLDRSFMYRLEDITLKAISGDYADKYVPYSAPGFEENGTVGLCESKLYEAGKCGILFNITKIK